MSELVCYNKACSYYKWFSLVVFVTAWKCDPPTWRNNISDMRGFARCCPNRITHNSPPQRTLIVDFPSTFVHTISIKSTQNVTSWIRKFVKYNLSMWSTTFTHRFPKSNTNRSALAAWSKHISKAWLLRVLDSGTPQRKSTSRTWTRSVWAAYWRRAGTSRPQIRSRSACISRNVDEIKIRQ